ncbi:MAG TPA: suppressor of fused domain protein [Candidatus Eisenbacteria bacterium]|nr:suppressor of fused domain protein [Candidatus Eisenbacteria bacterium]
MFVLVSDIEAREAADIIARVEDYDARVTHLRIDDAIVLEAPSLEDSGAAALLIIEPRLLKLFEDVPDYIAIGNTSVHCLLCIPLTSKEYRLKKERGVGAVLESFASSGRELARKGTLREKPN